MFNQDCKYIVEVNDDYFSSNRSTIKGWFFDRGLNELWVTISRAYMNTNYIIYFSDKEDMLMFKLSFPTVPFSGDLKRFVE